MNRTVYTPKPKFVQVVVDNGDGLEIDITPKPKEKRTMAQPGTARLPLVKSRMEHLFALTEREYDLCAHWNEGLKHDLDTAGAALKSALDYLDALPAGFVAPHKPVTRRFELLQPGNVVKVVHHSKKQLYMGKVYGKPLTIVSITDGWAQVKIEGDPQEPSVQTKHLVASTA